MIVVPGKPAAICMFGLGEARAAVANDPYLGRLKDQENQ